MDKLLPKSTNRRLRLLALLNSSGFWVPISQIANNLNCSYQTVISDCEYLETEWPDYLTIDFSKTRGFRLQTVKNHPISDLYKEIMKNSLVFSSLEMIFFNPGMESEFYKDQLFISDSSLYRTFRSLKPMLNERDIQLSQTAYKITGDNEIQIRYFLVSYFLEINKITDWPFTLDRHKLLEAIQIIKLNFPFDMSTGFAAYLLYSTAITIIREQQGFKVTPAIIKQKLACGPVHPLKKLDDFLEENFPEVDRQGFYLSVFWWDHIWDNPQEALNIQQIGEDFFNSLSISLKIGASEESKEAIVQWMTHIYSRHKFYPYEKFILYDTYLYSTASIKRTYPIYTRKVSEILEQVEQKTKFPWHSLYLNELLHKTLLLWTDLLESMDELSPELSVVIVSNIGLEHAKTLSYLIEKRFPGKLGISFVESESSLLKIEQYDFCISNYNLDSIDEKNLIVVEDIPSSKNWIDLTSIINSKKYF